MSMPLTKLRANLYTVIDQIIATGIPVEIERKGCIVKIMAEKPKNKLDNLIPHPGVMVGNSEDFVHMDWLTEWNEEKNL